MNRAVVTGLGPVSSIGIGRDAFLDALERGQSGIRPVTAFDCHALRSKQAGEITGFRFEDYIDSQKTYLDRASGLAFAAFRLALRDAGIQLDSEDRTRIGVLLGTAYGCMATMDFFFRDLIEKGPKHVRPILFPHVYANTPLSLLAIEYGIKGFHTAFSSGFTSSSSALLYGYDLITRGRAEIVLAGGVEALSEVLFTACSGMHWLSPQDDRQEGCFPFDERRNGIVLGEGAAMLVLEERQHAKKRGAHIYAEFAGGGMFSDGSLSGAGPDGSPAVANAMAAAVQEARATPAEVDYVSAGANSSIVADRKEAQGIEAFLGTNRRGPVVGSIKAATGETMGAAGALQAAAAVGAMQRGRIPPTLTHVRPEETFALRFAPQHALERDVRLALVNSIDPGGAVATLAFRKFEAGLP